MKILLLATIQLARVQRPAGSELELQDELARQLIDSGVAEAATAEEKELVAEKSDEEKHFEQLNAVDAIGYLATVSSKDLLNKLALIEKTRPKGVRKTVAEAFVSRYASIDAAHSGTAGGFTEEEEFFASLDDEGDATSYVAGLQSVESLERFDAIERAREGGARDGVLAAIAVRIANLKGGSQS